MLSHRRQPYFYRRKKTKQPGSTRLYIYTKEELQSIEAKAATEIIKLVSNEVKRFQCTLQKRDTYKNNFDITIVSLLVKISSGLTDDDADIRERAIKIMGEVFSERCDVFHMVLKKCVGLGALNDHVRLASLCDFFIVLLKKLPESTWRVLPVDELHQTVLLISGEDMLDGEDNLLPKAKLLLELRNEMKDHQHQVKLVQACAASTCLERSWDDDEYRTIDIFPKLEEINAPKPPFQLRPNIVDGKYDDWLHYYDIQFRLLREDFISPLRKGIGDYIHGKVGRDLRNVRLYHGVKILRPLFTKAGLCYEIKFDRAPFKGYNWDRSKRLQFGSMLCLSSDNFHGEVLFATVSNSEPRELATGHLGVMFQENAKLVAHTMLKTKFVMIESMAYFEASRHILRSLQVAEIATMPFTPYLISNDCAVVNPPNYLNNGEEASTYDMQFILKKEFQHSFTDVAITDSSQWPTLQMTELDESQLQAIQMALTQEVAVIQGPPGTGKTYIGLKIVQALLKNRHIWQDGTSLGHYLFTARYPILVMCLTNHALDQFLEGILDMHKGEHLRLVRIGGRIKSERIQKFSLYNVKQKLRNVPHPLHKRMGKLFREGESEGAKCSCDLQCYYDSKYTFFGFGEIKCVIDQHHCWSLLEFTETIEEEQIAMELWLGLYVKEVHEEKHEVIFSDPEYFPNDSDEESSSDDDESYTEIENASTSPDLGEELITEESRIEEDNRMFEEMKFEKLPFTRRKVIQHTCKIIEHHKDLKRHILKQSPMSERDVLKIQDIHDLIQLEDRYKLYMYWHKKYRELLMNRLEDCFEEFNEKCEDANTTKQETDRYALEAADVIGMTTTGAAKYQHILHLVKPKIVIVEEAAEVLESHIVSALNAGTQHLILIGDHKQLRPKTNEYDMEVKYSLHISLFERLVKNNFPNVTTLQIQHRMRPEIADLVRNHIYDVLHDHESVTKYPKVKGISSNLFLIQHSEPEKDSELSHSNEFEAAYLAALCKFLLQQGYEPTQITLLVTYTGQLLLMRNYMPKATFEGVRVTTVDNFQGEENDIILLSLVRSNEKGSLGFLDAENRVCVALSRAKHGFYCIGNFNMLRKGAQVWEKIVSDIESKGMVGESLGIHCNNHPEFMKSAKSPGDFAKYFPTGACSLPCEFRLKCGHVCTLTCHSSDPDHEKYKCEKPCNQQCPEGHFYEKLCYEESQCTELLQKTLPLCGHIQEVCCYYQDLNNVLCHHQCEKSCPEGHTYPSLCYQPCLPCEVLITVELPVCGHMQEKFCHQDIADIQCKAKCERKCNSGHPCPLTCYQVCPPCNTKVTKEFICGHSAKVQCSEFDATKCCEPCKKKLPCGHTCTGICGGPCIERCEVNSVKRTCQQGHQLLRKCFETFAVRPCNEKLLSGHLRQNLCSEICSRECKHQVMKKYPCGHQHRLPCSSPIEEHPCDIICRAPLACGHNCRGKCSDCRSTRIHKPCEYSITQQHFCGEAIQMKCVGLRDSHELKSDKKISSRLLHCAHNTIPYDQCRTDLYKCTEQCQWSCEHYSCTKLCHEICDRPPCDNKCPELMDCGQHKCIGLCGEPCIDTCPLCDPESFSKRFISPGTYYSDKQSYTQLTCGHIFTVQDMDKRVAERPSGVVGPLQCPECFSPLSCSFRYGNFIKESLVHVEAVKLKVKDLKNLSVEEKLRLKSSLGNALWLGFKNINFFSKPHQSISRFSEKLNNPASIISMEEGFAFYLLTKAFAYLFFRRQFIGAYQHMLTLLVEIVDSGHNYHQLSFQVLQDLMSEFYRLCFLAKLSVCQQALKRSSIVSPLLKLERVFMNDYGDPSRRFLKKDFVRYLKQLDKTVKTISAFESTEELIKDIEHFQPVIIKGRWQMCDSPSPHYYCVPVCKPGSIKMQCPECTGIHNHAH